MNDIFMNVVFWIISVFVVAIIGAFINSWWKRPNLSFELSNHRNRTFFFQPVDSELKLKGEKKYLHYIVIGVWLNTISNRGDETEIAGSKLRLRTNNRWSKWFSHISNKSDLRYDTPYDFAISLPEPMIRGNKKAIVGKNKKLDNQFVLFEPSITPEKAFFECELKIIPVKGRSAIKKFKVYEYSKLEA